MDNRNREERISFLIMSALDGLTEVEAVGSCLAVALGIMDARQSPELNSAKADIESVMEELERLRGNSSAGKMS